GDWRADPSDRYDHAERRHQVQAALDTLSPSQRQAIELAYFEGLSQSEIAERLKEPLGTVKTRVRLGMQKLRETLRPFYFERGTCRARIRTRRRISPPRTRSARCRPTRLGDSR